jgi:hypothetical protein
MKEEEGEKMIENVEILKCKNFFLWQVPKKTFLCETQKSR